MESGFFALSVAGDKARDSIIF